MDFEHPEYGQRSEISEALKDLDGIPEIEFVDNRGALTAWRISMVLCFK
jgi:hypothetical protein